MNHEVVCGNDREILVTIIDSSLEFDLIFNFEIKLHKVRGGPQVSNHLK